MSARQAEQRRQLEALYLAHERGLFNVAYRRVWDDAEARDVVHDAFVRLWDKRDDLDWERAPGLAYRIVLGIAANRRRTQRLRRWLGIVDDASDAAATAADAGRGPAAQLDDARLDRRARAAIDALPARLRDVLVLCTFTDLDYAQIGDALELPVGTVGSRRTEAVARLRAALADAPRSA